MVDRRERLLAVLRGESIDRVLCGFWFHFPPPFRRGTAAVRAHVDLYQQIDPDMLKVMNEHFYKIEKPIHTAEDWRGLRPLPFARTGYEEYVEEFRQVRKQLPKDLPLFATIHGVLVSAYHGSEGQGNFADPNNMVSRHFREDPEAVASGLRSIVETLAELIERLVKAGADGIYYAALGGEAHRFPRELFERYIIPLDRTVIDHVRDLGAISILHICKENTVIPMYAGIEADVVNWATYDNQHKLVDGRKIFPGKTLLGGFDDRSGVLVEGSAEEIAAKAAEIVASVGRERLILGADCTLPEDVDLDRIRAVHRVARRL